MFILYVEIGNAEAVYHSEYNSVAACREAMISLAKRGVRTHFATEWLGPKITVA